MTDFVMSTEDSGEKILPKTGLTQCVLTGIIDMGSQEYEYKGEKKKARKVELQFTLPQLTHTWEEEEGPQPFVLYRDVTMSMHKKSILRSIIQGILGKELDGPFDLESIAGMNSMVNIVHVERNGTHYANMDSFSPLMDGIEEAKYVCNILHLGEKFDQELFLSLPEWKQAIIKDAPEFIPF